MSEQTFEQWMKEVDAALMEFIGLESDDLADCAYADMYADEMTPAEAMRRVLEQNDFAEEYLPAQ